jgi:hypothetical protein
MYDNIPKPVVKPPKSFTKATSAAGVRQNLEWLKDHKHEYQGQWITLNEGTFLAADQSFLELYKKMERADLLKVALFISLK